MSDPNVKTMKLTTGTAKRSLEEHLSSGFLKPRDYGAVGDNSTDDRVAIQATLDAAKAAGKGVDFENLTYKVTSPQTTTITNVVDDPDGCLLTVTSTTGFATGDLPYIRGVDGVPNINGGYGIDVISAGTPGTILARDAAFSGAYVSGGTLTQPCLHLKQAQMTLRNGFIVTTSENCAVLTLDGFGGLVIDMGFDAGSVAGGVGLDYNWCQRDGDTVSSQSTGLFNLYASGSDYGLAIGMGQAMCSETLISKPFISGRTGIYIANQNALSQTIRGGEFAGCKDYGIYVAGGSCPVIDGVAFQAYPNAVLGGYGYIVGTTLTITAMTTIRHPGTGFEVGDILYSDTPGITDATEITALGTGTGGIGTYTVSNSMTFASIGSPVVIGVAGKADIYMPNGQNDAIKISGCRTESTNFAWLPYSQPYHIDACAHLGGGFFYHGAGRTKITASSSFGWLNPSGGRLEIDAACNFTLADYWRYTSGADPNNPAFLSITPPPIIPDATTARSTMGMDNGCVISFTSSSSITYTLTKTDASVGGANYMTPGSMIKLRRDGTGSLTIAAASGVTVHAPTSQGSITARARYSEVWVRVDDTNSYVVGGDITQ